MMSKLRAILANKIFWIVFAITIFGALVRVYNFEEWMHYQLDQARDYRVIHAAVEYGPGELPLQGPRAAGSFLRLGPLLYYLEYASALVFGDTPAGSVAVIYYLNVLAIPLFYLLIRRFFQWQLAIGLTGIFSASLFMIVYSRFGWNPNLIPFFVMLFMYALLRVSDREGENNGWWLVVAALALGFITSLHFVAFITMPIIAVIYLVWTRPGVLLRFWFLAIAVFLFLNTPLIVNDVKTGGDNLIEFFEVVGDRGGDEEGSHSLVDKAVKNVGFHTQYYWMILTGDQLAGLPETRGSDIKCGYDCRNGLVRGVISFIFIFFGIGSWIFLYRIEDDVYKKDFLRIVGIWTVVIFGVYTLLAFDLAPRFFLLNAPLMFIFLGLTIVAISKEYKEFGKYLGIILISLCIVANMVFVIKYFNELSRADHDAAFEMVHPDRILKEKTRITFAQMEKIIDWIESAYQKNSYPIFLHAQPEYKRAFWERIDIQDIPRDHIPKDLDPLYRNGNYFIIIRTQSNQADFLEKFIKGLNIIEEKNFGTLTGYYLQPKEQFITDERKIFEPEERDPRFSPGVQVRYLWRQVFEE